MANRTFQKSLLALAIGGMASTAAIAEDYTTSTLRGTVQDQAGNPVANADVLVTSDKGVRRSVTTDADGNLRIPQLPVGQYTVTISQDGYSQLTTENIPIQIGKSGDFTFTMESLNSTIEEVYVTGVRQGSWDFNSTTTGISMDVGEISARMPLARQSSALMLLAPGTSLGDTTFSTDEYSHSGPVVSVGGSSIAENVYYVNGMNVTNFRTFVGGSTIPFDFFDQIEVKTGGYQAEFGRSTGGVTNAVTKSGSNDFHFGVNAYYQPEGLYEQSPASYRTAYQYNEDSSTEYNIWASGAIIEDRLFYFGLYNPRKITDFECDLGRCEEGTQDKPFYAVKLDFIPFEGHRLEYTYFSDDQTREVKNWRFTNAGVAAIGDAGAIKNLSLSAFKGERIEDSKYINGGDNSIIKYTAALTDWATVSAMYGENEYQRENFTDTQPPVLRDRRDPNNVGSNSTTIDIGTWSVELQERGYDKRENWRVDADFYFDLAGEHHVRIGIDEEDLTSEVVTGYSGDLRARLEYSGTSSTGMRWRTRQLYNSGGFNTIQTAWYIQDSWKPLDNLTLNFGVRNETFDNRNIQGETYVETKDQLAPRFGFSWDPTNNGTTRVYGSYGHYYLPIATNTNIRLAGQETYFQEYFEAADATADGEPDYDANGFPVLGPMIGSRLYFADGTMPFGDATHDADLDPMYQTEWILGAEHTFADEWTVGLRYVNRDLASLIEDAAIDAAVISWANANGLGADPALAAYSGFHQYVLINPGESARIALVEDFGNDGVVDWVDFSASDLGYDRGKRTYKAIDLTVDRPWDGLWSFSGSYTWSESKGNYEGSVKSEIGQDDAGLTQDFDQPGLVDGAYGLLPNHRRHRVKLFGAYAINDQLTIGANFAMESPRKLGCIGEHPTDYFAWAYGAASWYCQGVSTPRGSQLETDWIRSLDMSLIWSPELSLIPGNGQLTMRMDVFNVLDADAVVDRRELGDVGFTSDTALGGTTVADPDPDYGKPLRFQSPRSIRFSINYNF